MTAQELLDLVGQHNPYNKLGRNDKMLFYIYNAGWMAAFIASACKQDPRLRILLKKTLEKTKK